MQALARFLTFVFPVIVVVAVQKAHATWIASPTYDIFPSWYFVFGLLYAGILALAAYGMGLPDPVLRKLYYGNALRIIPNMPRRPFPVR